MVTPPASAAKLPVAFVTDAMQDVRMVDGFARVFDLVVLAPKYLERSFVTWPSQERFRRAFLRTGRAGFVLAAAIWLIRRRRRFKVVIAQDNLTAALAANIAGLVTGVPVILRMGRTTEEYYRAKRSAGARGIAYWAGLAAVKLMVGFNERRAAAVGATSHYIAAESAKRSPRVRVIPAYGVDLTLFSDGDRQGLRQKLGLPEGPSLILWRSRLAPEKDPDTFFRAVRLLLAEGRDVVTLYAGAEYRDVAKIAGGYGVPIVAKDAVPPRELGDLYRAADVAVQTSKAEGFGISPLEALACGTPVVATAVGGLKETIVDGETGVSVAPGDEAATARGIAWVLDHPEEARELAANGRRMIERLYTDEIAFQGWKSLAHELAGGSQQ